jgi:hypothetical protein
MESVLQLKILAHRINTTLLVSIWSALQVTKEEALYTSQVLSELLLLLSPAILN